jgi:hypothetical protein
MFRRRAGLRFRRALSPATHGAMRLAHEHFRSGRYTEAAEAFESLAASAGTRSPRFLLRAGEAHVLAGNAERGTDLIHRAISMLAAGRRRVRLVSAVRHAAAFLRERGLEEAALQVEGVVGGRLHSVLEHGAQAEPARPRLPTRCPSCGAPLRSDDVEWTDSTTADCGFCGTPVRAA